MEFELSVLSVVLYLGLLLGVSNVVGVVCEVSRHLGIVPESVCLLGGGIGCETVRKGVTCSLVGWV